MGNNLAGTATSTEAGAVTPVGGKSMIYLPGFLKNWIVWSIGEAERLKGSPPWTCEVIAVFQMTCSGWINRGYLSVFMQNLYREDLFYADTEFTVWSLTGPDGSEERKTYELYSDRFRRLFPGYCLDKTMHVRPFGDTPKINLE